MWLVSNAVYLFVSFDLPADPPPTIRLLTPKAVANGKTTLKSKGCAFLEFSHRNALQQALKLHQSTLEGRMINVELTAGGGGKGERRLEKLKARNKQLLSQRVRLVHIS
jgi:nucleolar protein 6